MFFGRKLWQQRKQKQRTRTNLMLFTASTIVVVVRKVHLDMVKKNVKRTGLRSWHFMRVLIMKLKYFNCEQLLVTFHHQKIYKTLKNPGPAKILSAAVIPDLVFFDDVRRNCNMILKFRKEEINI